MINSPLGSDAVFGGRKADFANTPGRRKVGLIPSEVSRQHATVNGYYFSDWAMAGIWHSHLEKQVDCGREDNPLIGVYNFHPLVTQEIRMLWKNDFVNSHLAACGNQTS